MRRKKAETIAELAIARLGFRKGMQVLSFILAWQIAATDGGKEQLREITFDDYCYWWKVSHSTGYREQRVFREAFPTETTPQKFCEHIAKTHEQLQQAKVPKWALTP